MPELSLRSLKAEHYWLSLLAAGAKSVGLGTLEQTAKISLDYIAVLARKFFNHSLTPMLVSGEDVAKTTLALTTEVEHSTTLGHRASKVSEIVVIQDEKDRKKDANLPGRSGQAEDEVDRCEECVDAEAVEVISKKKLNDYGEEQREVPFEHEDEEEGLSASQVVVKVKNTKQKGSQPNPNNSKEKQKKKKETKGSEEKRIHFARNECPLCKKKVFNLTRHLILVHVHKNECIPMARVKPLKEMAVHGNKT